MPQTASAVLQPYPFVILGVPGILCHGWLSVPEVVVGNEGQAHDPTRAVPCREYRRQPRVSGSGEGNRQIGHGDGNAKRRAEAAAGDAARPRCRRCPAREYRVGASHGPALGAKTNAPPGRRVVENAGSAREVALLPAALRHRPTRDPPLSAWSSHRYRGRTGTGRPPAAANRALPDRPRLPRHGPTAAAARASTSSTATESSKPSSPV